MNCGECGKGCFILSGHLDVGQRSETSILMMVVVRFKVLVRKVSRASSEEDLVRVGKKNWFATEK